MVHFAKTLQKHLHEGDILFRSGGEEFTLFLRDKTFEECQRQIQEMLDSLHDHSVSAEFEEQVIRVPYSASFGLFYYKADPEQKTSMEKKGTSTPTSSCWSPRSLAATVSLTGMILSLSQALKAALRQPEERLLVFVMLESAIVQQP
ncbi:diguanylate cyclase domain-containing protein [Paenibacillus rhizoplanae]